MKFAILLSLTILLTLSTGCMSKLGDLSKAIGDKPGMTKGNVESVYGKVGYLHINPNQNHSYTVAPDGTVTIKAQESSNPAIQQSIPPGPPLPTQRQLYGR